MIDNTGSATPTDLVNEDLNALVFTNNTMTNLGGSIAFRGLVADPMSSAVVSGNAWDGLAGNYWAGIEVNNANDVDITNNSFTNMGAGTLSGEPGAAVQVWNIDDLLFEDNTIDSGERGLVIYGGIETTGLIRNNTFSNLSTASAHDSGGVVIYDHTNPVVSQTVTGTTITSNTFSNNTVDVHVGMGAADGDILVTGNTSFSTGGVAVQVDGGAATVTDTINGAATAV